MRTYGNWRKPQTAGLMGLGSAGTALLLAGLIVVVLVVMTGGLLRGLCVALTLGVLLLSLVVRDRHATDGNEVPPKT